MALKAGLLSDTHGVLHPQALKVLADCDVILHGGDMDTQAVFEALGALAPMYAVRGNNDGPWAQGLPRGLSLCLEGLKLYLVHDRSNVPRELGDTQVVVFGHSHRYLEEMREGRLWLNPGGGGRRRFRLPLTMALLLIEQGAYRVEKISLC